jgi:hypothetical protein
MNSKVSINWLNDDAGLTAFLLVALAVGVTCAILSTRRAEASRLSPPVQPQPARLGWAVGLLLGLIAGYFAGREHLKHDIRQEARGEADAIEESWSNTVRELRPATKYSHNGTDAHDERLQYINEHLVMDDIRVHRHDVQGQRRAFVTARLSNKGNRHLQRIRATVYLSDYAGNHSHEYAALVSFGGKSGLGASSLPAGHIDTFAIAPYDIPFDWDASRVQLTITGFD